MKLSIIFSTLFFLLFAIIGYFVIIGHQEKKYTLPGEISRCISHKITIYQYSSPKGEIEHYKEDYTKTSCAFENGQPSKSCQILLDSLENCSVVYRSPKFSKNLTDIYEEGAATAVDIVSRTKMLSIRL